MATQTLTEADLSEVDVAALKLALATARARDAAWVDELLRTEPWFKAARAAAICCQERALKLRPWQCWPPAAVEVDDVDMVGYEHRGITQSAALLRKMLRVGVSRFHPSPLVAIEQAKAKAR